MNKGWDELMCWASRWRHYMVSVHVVSIHRACLGEVLWSSSAEVPDRRRCLRISIIMITPWPNESYQGKSLKFLGHTLSLREARVGKQGRNLEVGTKAEPIKEHCLLACTACFFLPYRTTYPGMVPPTLAWTLPSQELIINQENTPTDLTTAQYDRGIFFSIKVLAS